MIVFEWFVDKHEIIDEELKDLENKVNCYSRIYESLLQLTKVI